MTDEQALAGGHCKRIGAEHRFFTTLEDQDDDWLVDRSLERGPAVVSENAEPRQRSHVLGAGAVLPRDLSRCEIGKIGKVHVA